MASFQPEDFPILCETCLGDNPYLRMTRERFAKACKICDRPFTVYRWRPGPRSRFKKTEICATCAKLKNVCQTCILDLQYGLPVQVRDDALNKQDLNSILNKDVLPVSHPNRNYMYEQLEHQVGLGGTNTSLQLPYNTIAPSNGGNPMLSRIQRKGPYYKRNLPHICSFYVRGDCNRGDACPYRHVHPSEEQHDEKLKDQNIKDRFYGVNDPVANKIMKKYQEWEKGTASDDDDGTDTNKNKRKKVLPSPPQDKAIRSLFIGGINWSISEDAVRHKFKTFGEISSIALIQHKKCGFVTFKLRESAENAMSELYDLLWLNEKKCELNWAIPKGSKEEKDDSTAAENENTNSNEKAEANEEDSSERNDGNEETITEKDKKYLEEQGILPPQLPPMPDPCSTDPTYLAKKSTAYKSMTAHYQEAKI